MTKQTETKTRLEHFSIVHNGVSVDVLVNYEKMQVSIVDNNRQKKKWMFCERGMNYQAGWDKILEGIKEAMDMGFEKLRARQEEDEDTQIKKMILLGGSV